MKTAKQTGYHRRLAAEKPNVQDKHQKGKVLFKRDIKSQPAYKQDNRDDKGNIRHRQATDERKHRNKGRKGQQAEKADNK